MFRISEKIDAFVIGGLVIWGTYLGVRQVHAVPIEPATLNPSFWLDAQDATTLTLDGGFVDQWNDKAGSNNVTPPTSGQRPTFVSNGINGLPSLQFGTGGFNDQILISQGDSGFSGTNFGLTIFVVSQMIQQNRFATMIGQSPGVDFGGLAFIADEGFAPGQSYIATDAWHPSGSVNLSFLVSPAEPVFLVAATDNWANQSVVGGSLEIFVNPQVNGFGQTSGIYNNSGTPSNLLAGPWHVGNWDATRTDMQWRGYIGEVIVFDRKLTEAELAGVTEFQAAKWARVPEPSSAVLLLLGGPSLLVRRWRRRSLLRA